MTDSKKVQTFNEAVETFLAEAEWLDAKEHAPMIAGLWACADALDETFRAATLTEMNKTYKYLLELKPEVKVEETVDELEALLQEQHV
jgi:hypothetical protein